ncbi:type VI secretion system-associated protein VasI [Morganella morganii]|uniref:type VI secretion system-associated protein VasI n=1 Tax=Morganella morganii TaxID=582 RepID=UPI003EBD602C
MTKRMLQSVFTLLILTPLWSPAQSVPALSGEISALLDTCRKEPSPLIRLDCYDNIGRENAVPPADQTVKGEIRLRAAANEEKRTAHTVTFITTQPREGTWPVVMTAPAIGTQPPRPVLMLSCVDNITRMQLVMNSPVTTRSIRLSTPQTTFSSDWFIRENGYVLESSRGLAGIDEIKRIMTGDKLTITPENGKPVTFDLSQLTESIKPLRAACRW